MKGKTELRFLTLSLLFIIFTLARTRALETQRHIQKQHMYQKFIITSDGVLRFGRVYQHRDLLQWGEECPYGGRLWKICEERRAVLLYGRSFAFGPPELDFIRRIEWSGIDGTPRPLFFLPRWPNEEELIPVYAR